MNELKIYVFIDSTYFTCCFFAKDLVLFVTMGHLEWDLETATLQAIECAFTTTGRKPTDIYLSNVKTLKFYEKHKKTLSKKVAVALRYTKKIKLVKDIPQNIFKKVLRELHERNELKFNGSNYYGPDRLEVLGGIDKFPVWIQKQNITVATGYLKTQQERITKATTMR